MSNFVNSVVGRVSDLITDELRVLLTVSRIQQIVHADAAKKGATVANVGVDARLPRTPAHLGGPRECKQRGPVSIAIPDQTGANASHPATAGRCKHLTASNAELKQLAFTLLDCY